MASPNGTQSRSLGYKEAAAEPPRSLQGQQRLPLHRPPRVNFMLAF